MSGGAGKIYFVGAGTGDPGLLTLRGAEVLARCEVLVHDRDVHGDVLAFAPPSAARVVAETGAGGEAAIARARAGSGCVVGRVLQGDPTLAAGGAGEIASARAAGVAFEIVPGVPSLAAVGAYAGLALGRAEAGHGGGGAEGDAGDAIVVGATRIFALARAEDEAPARARALLAQGTAEATPAALLADVSRPSQAVVCATLGEIASGAAAWPVLAASAFRARNATGAAGATGLLVVGDAARPDRRDALSWFGGRPLSGKRVLVTRARDQAATTAALLRERGAEAVLHPTIELHPPRDVAAVRAAVARLHEYAFVAFTSANGVERAWTELRAAGGDARAFGAARLAAIGPGTAQALASRGLYADVVAKEFKGEGLAEAILAAMPADLAARRVLLLRAQVARDALPDLLRAAGCAVDVVAVYETRAAPAAVALAIGAELERGGLDAVTFTSSSTVDNLCDLLGSPAAELLARARVASIGPITTATAERRGVRVDVTARAYTVRGLVDALEASFAPEAAALPPG